MKKVKPSPDREAAAYLNQHIDRLSAMVVERHYALHPDVAERYGDIGRKRCNEDAHYHFQYLAQALAVSTTAIFSEYVAWAKIMLAARGIPATDLTDNLHVMGTVIQEQLPRDLSVSALHYLMAGVFVVSSSPDELPSYIAHDDPLSDLVRQYMKALLAYDKASAGKVILDAAERGVPVRAIYDHVFARVQREIGRLWQLNKLTVAEEHYCTAATQIIMGQLSRYIPAPKKHGRVMVGACATGDLHELGSHMLCDVFEMEGWDTTFVGANVPISSAVRMVRARRAEVLAISASISYHIGAVEKLIATLRASAEFDRVKILVGGAAFETEGLWKKIGADAYARTPDEAVAAVE